MYGCKLSSDSTSSYCIIRNESEIMINNMYSDLLYIPDIILLQRIQSNKLETLRDHIKRLVQSFCHDSYLIGPYL